MRESRNQDLQDLFRQIDDLMEETGDHRETEYDGIELADFTPRGTQIEEPMIYQNYSNNYGAYVRNYSNNYGEGQAPAPQPQAEAQPGLPVYNADFRKEQEADYRKRTGEQEREAVKQDRPCRKRRRKRRGCGCGCGTILALLVLVVFVLVGFFNSFVRAPEADVSIGERKEDTAAILLCGTDKDGTRTDTMILLYLSGSENRVGMLSLPRDSLMKTSTGRRVKLNAAYGINNCGQEGMEALLDYVERTVGYRPDGYILVDMTLVPDVVDLMGGVDMDVQHHIRVDEVYFPAGQQHLDGEQVLAMLRYRAGYYNADIGRVAVQRSVVQACMEQWLTPEKLALLPQALDMVMDRSTTDLTMGNFLWIGKTIFAGMDNIYNDTLPGVADMIDGASYYVLDKDAVAEMVDESYNPYNETIDADDLKIAG